MPGTDEGVVDIERPRDYPPGGGQLTDARLRQTMVSHPTHTTYAHVSLAPVPIAGTVHAKGSERGGKGSRKRIGRRTARLARLLSHLPTHPLAHSPPTTMVARSSGSLPGSARAWLTLYL